MRAILPLLKAATSSPTCWHRRRTLSSDDNGRLFPDVLAARRRGVFWFDIANGRTDTSAGTVAER